MNFTALEILVIILAFVIVFVLLRVFRRDTLADKKRQDIEMKRAAIIAKRKAKAEAEAREKVQGSDPS
jgi:uncharacterized membrane protein